MSLWLRDPASVVALFAVILGLAAPVLADDKDRRPVVTIATGDWQPYVDSGSADYGPLGRVIKVAFDRAGYDVQYQVFPWTRNAMIVANGDFDAMMPYYCSEARAKAYLCSDAIVAGEQVVFHRTDTRFDWSAIDDLSGYNIGATLGYFYGGAFEQAEHSGQLRVVRIAEDERNLKLLLRGRIDLYPQDLAVGYGMIRVLFPKEYWHKLTHHPRPLHSEPLHLLFSRATGRGEQLMKTFNDELQTLRDSGKLDQLLSPIYADQRAVMGLESTLQSGPAE
ncbi:substrate-binding periplasmic protein [Marinobacter caseinilyticus]|uniref:substrate-binding periplasmic protein n=1 Tax=Marinobacter caseinilyticus TaxID=2692195 RepID=UPI0014086242|nr:transporter substrate-binding domain-containing protein [Marinobacter caseinilyticus]